MSDTERDDFVCIRCGAYLKNFAEIAELKAEIEPLRQWYADSHRIIDEWDTKCGALKARVEELEGGHRKMWIWQNFADGKPEYWAFDNPYPVNLADDDPQTLGEPCGYAIIKKSRNGRPEVTDREVLLSIKRGDQR